MASDLQPELWVADTASAITFYERAFGAVVEHRGGADDAADGVAQLSVGGGRFWLAGASDRMARFNPSSIGGGTARFLLVAGEPETVVDAAVAAGGTCTRPVAEEHGWLIGRVVDPFGHEWEIGHPVGVWPPQRL